MKNKTILLGLNELNVEYILFYINKGLLPNFKKLFDSQKPIETISEDEYSNCVAQIGDLHNFDKIELFGGRIISGDLLKLNLKDKTFDLKQLIKGQKVEILCIRTKLILFFLAVFGKGSLFTLTKPYEKIKVRPTDTILFHCAGEPHPQEFNLANIKSFQRG